MSGPSERTAQARPGAPKTALQTSDALTSYLAPAGTDDVIRMTSTRKERVARERATRERVECLSMATRRPSTPLNHSDRPRVTQSTYAVTGRHECSTLDLFLLMPALALILCFNVELMHHERTVSSASRTSKGKLVFHSRTSSLTPFVSGSGDGPAGRWSTCRAKLACTR